MEQENGHRKYIVNGVEYPSVTQVLAVVNKPYLVTWANRMGLQGVNTQYVLEKAASIGTLTHKMINMDLSASAEPLDAKLYPFTHWEAAQRAFASFMMWKKKQGEIKPVRLESAIASAGLRYGGTLDALVYLNGKLTLIDFKTSASIHKEYFAQLAAYGMLYDNDRHEWSDYVEIEDMIVLRLGKEGAPSYEESHIVDRQSYESYFFRALDLYYAQKEIADNVPIVSNVARTE